MYVSLRFTLILSSNLFILPSEIYFIISILSALYNLENRDIMYIFPVFSALYNLENRAIMYIFSVDSL